MGNGISSNNFNKIHLFVVGIELGSVVVEQAWINVLIKTTALDKNGEWESYRCISRGSNGPLVQVCKEIFKL